MAETTRLIIAGAGLMGQQHAMAIDALAHVSLVGIVDPDANLPPSMALPGSGREFAMAKGLPLYESVEAALAQARPDGMILSSPNKFHIAQGLACIEANCPMLVEKPIASSTEEGLSLVRMAVERNVPLLVGHHRRYSAFVQRAHEAIEAGIIGEARALQGTCWLYKPDDYFSSHPWRKQRGAGPVLINLVHDLDLMRYFFGDVKHIQAQSVPSQRGYENEELAAVLLRFRNGMLGTLSIADGIASPWSWEMTAGENPAYPQTTQSCYWIGGTRGALSLPDLTHWRHEGSPHWWHPFQTTRLDVKHTPPLVTQISHFADVIAGRAKPKVTGQDGLRALQLVEAIHAAAASGNSIPIDDPIDAK